MRKSLRRTLGILTLLSAFSFQAQAQVQVDKNLQAYKPQGQVTGTIKSVGSDTMNNMMTLWAEGFRKFHPGVQIDYLTSPSPDGALNPALGRGLLPGRLKDLEFVSP